MRTVLLDLRLILTLSFASLVLIFLDNYGLLNIPKFVIQTVTVPIQYGVFKSAQSIGKQFDFIFSARYASQENKALKIQLGELLTENARLQKEIREFKALTDQETSLGTTTYNLIPAHVVGVGRFLTIDRGSDHGLASNQVVLFKDHYIGTIKTTLPKSSQVILPQDPDSKIAVFAQNESGRSRGILEGQFGSEMLMDKILHQEPIAVGDLVYSDGVEGKIPRGLIIGTVTDVEGRENEVFKRAKVKAVFDPAILDIVFVTKGE